MKDSLVEDRTITSSLLAQPHQVDRDSNRRRALAKVYELLIKLAEEREKQKTLPEAAKQEEVEVSVPLQKNIPPAV